MSYQPHHDVTIDETRRIDAYREGYTAGFKAGIAEGKRALRRELKKQAGGEQLRQLVESLDEKLVGDITFCECPPPWMRIGDLIGSMLLA